MGDVGSSIMSGLSDFGSGIGSIFSGGVGAGADAYAPPVDLTPPMPAADIVPAAPAAPAVPDISTTGPAAVSSAMSAESAIPNGGGDLSGALPIDTSGLNLPNDPLLQGVMGSDPNALIQTPESVAAVGSNIKPYGGGSSMLSQFASNPNTLKDILGLGELAAIFSRSNQSPPGLSGLQGLAKQQQGLANSGEAVVDAARNGLLPAGAQSLLQSNLDAEIAGIKSKYAQMGMSGSTMEQQDINAAREKSLADTFTIGNSLAQQGLSQVQTATGAEADLLTAIMQAETSQQTQMGDALAGLVGAMAQ